MEHIGAVSMGGEELNIPVNSLGEALFSFFRGDLCIWFAPNLKEPLEREEIVSVGGRLMSEREILSRIRRLQASGADNWMSRIALNLLRSAKKDALMAEERGLPLNCVLDLISL